MKIPQIRKFKFGKTWIVLSVSLGIGALAAVSASSYLSSRVDAIEARAKGKMVNVVVAKRDLPKGAQLTNDSVAVRGVPAEFAQSLAVTPEGFDRLNGQVLAYPVKSGEMILWGLIEGKRVPTFSTRVDEGHRAMTVPVDEINSISGLLEPGDVVDLMATVSQKDKKITFPLLQGVEVMATGQRSVDDPKSGTRRDFSTVTLNTTPEQAKNIIVARDAGKITALLRNPKDKQALGEAVDVASLLGLKSSIRAGTDVRDVPVLYGGAGNKLPTEGLHLGQYVATANLQRAGEVALINQPSQVVKGPINSPLTSPYPPVVVNR